MKNAQNAHTVNVWNTLNWIYEFQYRDFHDKIHNEDVVICFIFLIRLKNFQNSNFVSKSALDIQFRYVKTDNTNSALFCKLTLKDRSQLYVVMRILSTHPENPNSRDQLY